MTRTKRVHHSHPKATVQQIVEHPMLDWERSDCDCCDEGRDFILDASVRFDREDDEGLRVFLVVRNDESSAYWEYDDRRHYFDSILGAIVDAERWVRRCMREYKRQGRLRFTDGTDLDTRKRKRGAR